MADKKISQLTGAATPLAGTEVLPVVQGGSTVKVSVDNLTAGKSVTASQYKVVSATGTTEALLDMQTVWSSPSGNKSLVWKDATSALGRISVDYTAPTARMAFGSLFNSGYQTANLLEISGDGNVTVNTGNLKVGTAAKGIDFSANTHAAGMTSELLNWYEEGTWTPTLKFGGATTGITYTTQTGTYTRIGRMVHARATITLSSNGSASGGATVTGLPFNSAVTTAASIYQDGISYTGSLNVAVEGTVDRFTIQQVSEAGANSNLDRTNFSNTASFTLAVCYQV